jgi:hypothetical protein
MFPRFGQGISPLRSSSISLGVLGNTNEPVKYWSNIATTSCASRPSGRAAKQSQVFLVLVGLGEHGVLAYENFCEEIIGFCIFFA